MSSHSTAPPLPKRSVRRSESKTSSVFSIPPSPNPTHPNSHPPTQLTCSTNTSTAFQQSKIKFNLATNTLNTICILIFVSANIVNLTITDVFSVVLVNVYGLVLGLVLLANEVKHHRIATEYFKFTTTWKGRGLLYILFGSLVIQPKDYNLFAGIFLLSIGIGFFLASFTRNIGNLESWETNLGRYSDFQTSNSSALSRKSSRRSSSIGVSN